MLSTLLIFLAVLSLLVFIHEFGHFLTARLMGIKVEEFGFGFPPRLWGWRRGQTIYSLNWIPVGGFVRLKGETGEASGEPDSYLSQSVTRRGLIVISGVLMNFLLAFGLFTIGLMIGLPQTTDQLPAGARVRDRQAAIGRVLPDSPAEKAGLKAGDLIMTIDDQSLVEIRTIQAYLSAVRKEEVRMNVRRLGEEIRVAVKPEILSEIGKPGIGVGLFEVGIVSFPWYFAPVRGAQLTVSLTSEILRAFGHVFGRLVTSGELAVDVSGPVGIAVLTGRAAALGFAYLLQFAAILSLNLAIINFLPFPALDGGRFLFLILEKTCRRPVPRRVEMVIHQLGFALLLTLVIIVTYRDLARFSGTILGGLRQLF